MSDFKYIVPPYEPKLIKSPGDVGIAPSVPLNISNSCLFNGNSSYLTRTFSQNGNQTTATLSMWFKRGRISRSNYGDMLWHSYNSGVGPAPGNYHIININGTSSGNTDQMQFSFRNGGTYQSSQVFRDPSAWYHLVVNYDSSNPIQSERFRFYINGIRGTFVSAPAFSLNYAWESAFNLAIPHVIGWYFASVDYYLDGYVAETHFIDGQALTPDNFGIYSNRTNSWIPKKYTRSYGLNGFYLKFDNSSSLGSDSSGNNNTFSLTGITSSNQTTDTPSNNFVTLNVTDLNSSISSVSGGNTTFLQNSNPSIGIRRGTIGVSSGKWYFEATPTNVLAFLDHHTIGIIGENHTLSNYVGAGSNGYGYRPDANKLNNGTATSYGLTTTSNTDVVMVAFDADNWKIWFGKNGTWFASGDPVAGTNAAFSSITPGTYYFAVGSRNSGTGSAVWTCYFGRTSFNYTPPTGFKSLCTANFSIPTIRKPNQYFDAITYTGNGAARNITGFNFAPDLIWVKNRTSAYEHVWNDIVRGAGYRLFSNTTGAESPNSNAISSLNKDGFSIGTDLSVNENAANHISWGWCAGSSTVTNTAGTITSTVRANPQAGFSIVSFTDANASNYTIGHGLGTAPAMIIEKNRTGAAENWLVYHKSTGATGALFLDTTNAFTSNSAYFNNTSPTASVFTLGAYTGSKQRIAYCFAEIEGYSKFGSFAGNNNPDGPFCWCGFRPKYIMVKKTSATGPWMVFDSSRDLFNVATTELRPNEPTAEPISTRGSVDFLSNGFKVRSTSTTFLGELGDFIFAAFAEVPFKYANAR